MVHWVEAIYENGALRLLEPLDLGDSQRVTVTISDASSSHRLIDTEMLAYANAEVAKLDRIPTLEQVQRMMSKIPGSLVQDCIDEREER